MLRERQHHGRIVPADKRPDPALQKSVQQDAQRFVLGVIADRQLRRDDSHTRLRTHPHVQARLGEAVDPSRFLPEDHGRVDREALHQMLRPLKDEIPSKMAEAEQREAGLRFQDLREGRVTTE